MYSGYSYTTFDDLTLHLLQQIRSAKVLDIGYNDVRSQSALDLMKNPAETFEVIILGNVIEPMRKSEGQDLLEYLNDRAACLLVITPEAMCPGMTCGRTPPCMTPRLTHPVAPSQKKTNLILKLEPEKMKP